MADTPENTLNAALENLRAAQAYVTQVREQLARDAICEATKPPTITAADIAPGAVFQEKEGNKHAVVVAPFGAGQDDYFLVRTDFKYAFLRHKPLRAAEVARLLTAGGWRRRTDSRWTFVENTPPRTVVWNTPPKAPAGTKDGDIVYYEGNKARPRTVEVHQDGSVDLRFKGRCQHSFGSLQELNDAIALPGTSPKYTREPK